MESVQFAPKNIIANGVANTMILGSSPEFDMAVYTLCFLARPDEICGMTFDGEVVDIITKSKVGVDTVTIDTAYPLCNPVKHDQLPVDAII